MRHPRFARFLTTTCLATVLAAAGASCANTGMPRTGFLSNYEQLEAAPEHEVAFVPDDVDLFLSPKLAERRYRSAVIEPVVYRPADGVDHEPSAEAIVSLEEAFHRKLRRTLHPDFEIVTEPRPDSLRVRAAIAEVDPANVWINVVTLVLLLPVDMGGIAAEIEVLDAGTGERLLAMTARRDGSPLLILESFTTYGYARHGMKKWSRLLLELLTASPPADS